ncbi:MAG: hypothetical protein RR350_08925, partial [Oscillibacter sp.]
KTHTWPSVAPPCCCVLMCPINRHIRYVNRKMQKKQEKISKKFQKDSFAATATISPPIFVSPTHIRGKKGQSKGKFWQTGETDGRA